MSRNSNAWIRAAVHSSAGWMCYVHQLVDFPKEILDGMFLWFLTVYLFLIEGVRIFLHHFGERLFTGGKGQQFMDWYQDRWIPWWLRTGGLREEEKHTLTSSAWYWAGLGLVYFTQPLSIVIPATLILAFGDPAARLFGVNFGTPTRFLRGKSFEGCTGFVLASFVAIGISLFIDMQQGCMIYEGMNLLSLLVAIMVGCTAEILGSKLDNLLIPVSAALTILLLGK